MDNVIRKQQSELNVPLFSFITNFSAHLKIHYSHPIVERLKTHPTNCELFYLLCLRTINSFSS